MNKRYYDEDYVEIEKKENKEEKKEKEVEEKKEEAEKTSDGEDQDSKMKVDSDKTSETKKEN